MRFFLFLALFAITCGYAFWRGGAAERLVAGIFIAGLAGTAFFRAPFETRFGSLDIGIFVTDSMMLCALVAVALNVERFWPLWMSAFQTIQVLSHLPPAIMPHLLPLTYGVIVGVWAYPMLAILAIGTTRHRQRMLRYGTDRSWSDFSAPRDSMPR